MKKKILDFFHNLELSSILTVIGIIFLFSFSVSVVLFAPLFVNSEWTEPTTPYQVQIYEVSDPNFYISSSGRGNPEYIYHLTQDYTLLAFQEHDSLRIVSAPDLEKFVTRIGDPKIKLTSKLLLLRSPEAGSEIDKKAKQMSTELQKQWAETHPDAEKNQLPKPAYQFLELYAPESNSAFAHVATDGILENWVDKGNYLILDEIKNPFHADPGVIYVSNPQEYRVSYYTFNSEKHWHYDPKGKPIASLEELRKPPFGFLSRQEMIRTGEHIYAIEGCWYCHTDQTRTLVQDTVLNGSPNFPAPPSSPNEYIYQRITFPGTRRIGPDMSRAGVKRQSRDWHMGHFWSPKTASAGSIMPSFRHFFDSDPSGTAPNAIGIPNYQFEAIYQYLMTKGTRITPPTQAWWEGKDPINTKAIIERRQVLP